MEEEEESLRTHIGIQVGVGCNDLVVFLVVLQLCLSDLTMYM